jgi:diguanylate cyclase (GGDEF)-like protein
MTNQQHGAFTEADRSSGLPPTERFAYVRGLIWSGAAAAVSVMGLAVATALTTGTARYLVAVLVTFVMVLPISYLIIRVQVSQQRRAAGLVVALTRQLAEAVAIAERYRQGFVEAPSATGTVFDVTRREEAQGDLDVGASYDKLTGLANRDLFMSRIEHAVQRQDGPPAAVAVLFLDLDDFKAINDRLGHSGGDQLLIAVAERIASVARTSDTVARLVGDEFAVLLVSGQMPEAAEDMARQIADNLRPPFFLADTEVSVRSSIGIATSGPSTDVRELLRDADLAMYLAKGNGKNRFETARPGTPDEALNRIALVTDLRYALDDDRIDVFYQPIVNAHTCTPAGAEALLRWHHPRRGLIPPTEFMAVAEAGGLIVPVGDWVLNRACRQVQAWRQARIVDDDFFVSVNISARQLAEPGLVDSVGRALDESGLTPGSLVLEITETTLLLHLAVGLTRLQALRGLGVRLALDNYGTGSSSLTRLEKLPIDIVKIDKTLIDHVADSSEGRARVQSVLEVTQTLGIGSIAQGVEQSPQRTALDEIGCRCLQGHLVAEPMLPGEMVPALEGLAGLAVTAA